MTAEVGGHQDYSSPLSLYLSTFHTDIYKRWIWILADNACLLFAFYYGNTNLPSRPLVITTTVPCSSFNFCLDKFSSLCGEENLSKYESFLWRQTLFEDFVLIANLWTMWVMESWGLPGWYVWSAMIRQLRPSKPCECPGHHERASLRLNFSGHRPRKIQIQIMSPK